MERNIVDLQLQMQSEKKRGLSVKTARETWHETATFSKGVQGDKSGKTGGITKMQSGSPPHFRFSGDL